MNITALKQSVELSIVGTCLAVATPLFASAKQVACLLELDIIDLIEVCLVNLFFCYWSLLSVFWHEELSRNRSCDEVWSVV